MQSLTDFILQYTGHFTLKERGGGGVGSQFLKHALPTRQTIVSVRSCMQEAPTVLDKHSYYFVKTLHQGDSGEPTPSTKDVLIQTCAITHYQ